MKSKDWTGYKFINVEGLEATVIQDFGYINGKEHKVIVQFTISGCTKESYINNIRTGKITDPMHGVKMFEWRQSNAFGEYMIIEDLGNYYYPNNPHHMVKCKWKNTGSISIYRFDHAKNGSIKDWYAPILFGVACHGEIDCYEEDWAYQEWKHMLSRCFYKNDTHYKSYGEQNITVDPRWLNYANFVRDIKELEGYDKKLLNPSEYEIDKDFLQKNLPIGAHKVYSKETCMFIHKSLNNYLRYNSSSVPVPNEYKIPMYRNINK